METASCPKDQKMDPRVRRTRKLIEEAFRALLSEKSYGEISIVDVTERATVNRATFYSHFEGKEHLATDMLKGDLEAALMGHLHPGRPLNVKNLTDVAEALFEFMGKTLGACPKHADEFATTLMTTLQEATQRILECWIERDPDSMSRFQGSTRETVTTVVSWSLFGGAIRWSKQARRPPAREAAGSIVAMLFR